MSMLLVKASLIWNTVCTFTMIYFVDFVKIKFFGHKFASMDTINQLDSTCVSLSSDSKPRKGWICIKIDIFARMSSHWRRTTHLLWALRVWKAPRSSPITLRAKAPCVQFHTSNKLPKSKMQKVYKSSDWNLQCRCTGFTRWKKYGFVKPMWVGKGTFYFG